MTQPAVLHERILGWYDEHARDLPWRRPEASAWGVLVSELMLQQTPVSRVLSVWQAWTERWATPAALAADTAGEAVRMWGRLGYPRRALRLHAAATMIVAEHHGEVPSSIHALRALPGVGEYTAAAVASFAFGQRHAVLDTNVRRVLARSVAATALPPAPSTSPAERAVAESLLPESPATAAAWAVAVMELGALVCTARDPACGRCPVRDVCAWRGAGQPRIEGSARRTQRYAGTDRQCRGRLLGLVREADEPVHRSDLDAAWRTDPAQRDRCLASLLTDGLLVEPSLGVFTLP